MRIADEAGVECEARGRLTRALIPWGPARFWDFWPLAVQVGAFRAVAGLAWLLGVALLAVLAFPTLLPRSRGGGPEHEMSGGFSYAIVLALGLMGVWGLRLARVAAKGSRRIMLCRLHRRCAACLYDLSGVATATDGYARCPECAQFWRVRPMPKAGEPGELPVG